MYRQKGQWDSWDPTPGQGCRSTTADRVIRQSCTFLTIQVQVSYMLRKWGHTEWVLKAAMILDSASSQSSSTYALLTKPCVVWRTWSSTTKKLHSEKTSYNGLRDQNNTQIKSFNDHYDPKTALQSIQQNPGNSAARSFGFWQLFQTSSHDYPVQKSFTSTHDSWAFTHPSIKMLLMSQQWTWNSCSAALLTV